MTYRDFGDSVCFLAPRSVGRNTWEIHCIQSPRPQGFNRHHQNDVKHF